MSAIQCEAGYLLDSGEQGVQVNAATAARIEDIESRYASGAERRHYQ